MHWLFMLLVAQSVWGWEQTVREEIEDTKSICSVQEVLAIISVESQGDERANRENSKYHGLTQIYGGALEMAARRDGRLRKRYCKQKKCDPVNITGRDAIRTYLVTQKIFSKRTSGHVDRALLWKMGPSGFRRKSKRARAYKRRYLARLQEIVSVDGVAFGQLLDVGLERNREARPNPFEERTARHEHTHDARSNRDHIRVGPEANHESHRGNRDQEGEAVDVAILWGDAAQMRGYVPVAANHG